MPGLRILLDGDGEFPELAEKEVIRGEMYAVTALPGGMASGKPSVAILAKVNDNTHLFLETSMDLFLTAAKAFEARYGNQEKPKQGFGELNAQN